MQPIAKVAQLVEHDLAKVGVASSNLVFRSKTKASIAGGFFVYENSKFELIPYLSSIQKTITFAPSNLDLQVSLAECYVEGKEAIMKGVKMLQDVTAKDSTHIGANLLLGKLAITSGQYDKALVRLEKLVAFAPENSEALYYLGETYLALGEKEKAVDVFEKCKKLVKNPAFSKELDEYIKNNIGK